MGASNGLIYNNGMALNANVDWLEIDKLTLGDPEILKVDDGYAAAPTKSFIQLEQGATPSISQCHSITTTGMTFGSICVLRGLSSSIVTMVYGTGNVHIESPNFALSTYSTMVLLYYGGGWTELARSDNN